MIKNALSVLPTRPVVYIAPLIIVLVMCFYYLDLYTECQRDVHSREELNKVLRAENVKQFYLKDFTKFTWQKVRIIPSFNPEEKVKACPFGWGWTNKQRENLMESGLITVIIFINEGRIVEYLEVQDNHVSFDEMHGGLSPENAIFSIERSTSDREKVRLNLIK